MSNEVLTLDQVIALIRAGQPPVTVVEDATGPVFGDPHRPDDRAEFLAGYNKIVQDISHYDGTIGIDFPAQVADALTSQNPQVRDDLVALATMNRADANRSAGEVRMWTDILRGIHATPIDAPPAPPAPSM